MFHPQERTALFIDGANLYAAARALGFDVDYKRLLDLFKAKSHLVRAYYYTVLIEDQEYSPIRPLVDWLDYNGYTLVTKPAKEYTDQSGRRRIRNSTDVELAVDMMELAPRLDHAVLLSGDGGFRRLVDAVQRMGTRVTAVSTVRSSPPMVADELRRQADHFIDLKDLQPDIERARERRPAAPAKQSYEGEEGYEDYDDEYEYEDDYEDEADVIDSK
ncbi:MAG: NYN domain-containing protein [Alphaproteobacteria bacterium]